MPGDSLEESTTSDTSEPAPPAKDGSGHLIGPFHRSNSSHMFTEKEEKWNQFMAEGMSAYEAAKKAGYLHPSSAAYQLVRRPRLIEGNRLALNAQGLHVPRFVTKIVEGLEATRPVKIRYVDDYTEKGAPIYAERLDFVPDWEARAVYLQIGIRLGAFEPEMEHKLVVADERSQGRNSIPDNFQKLTEDELLEIMQKRRENRPVEIAPGEEVLEGEFQEVGPME